MDGLIVLGAFLATGLMVMPPRAEERRWLAAGLLALWAALVVVGLRRGVLAGYEGWLVLLALMAALAGLLVVWSVVNVRSTRRAPDNGAQGEE